MINNYKERKAKGLARIGMRKDIKTIMVDGKPQEEKKLFFYFEDKRFDELEGSERPHAHQEETNKEILLKEKELLLKRIEDVDEAIADIETLETQEG